MTTMTFDEFKAIIIAKVGEDKVIFHEFGKYGYTTIDDILDKKPGGRPGVHECQARSINRNRQLLFGHYNFNTQEAKFWD